MAQGLLCCLSKPTFLYSRTIYTMLLLLLLLMLFHVISGGEYSRRDQVNLSNSHADSYKYEREESAVVVLSSTRSWRWDKRCRIIPCCATSHLQFNRNTSFGV